MKEYPLTAKQLAKEVQNQCPDCGTNTVWQIIASEGLKHNTNYSKFVFNSRESEQRYEETGALPVVAISIYNPEAVDYIVNVYRQTYQVDEE